MNAFAMDIEIERMRNDGVESADIGLFIEERVEFIHSRISLRPLMNGLHNFEKMKKEFESRPLTRFGKFLFAKIDQMADRIESKAEQLNGRKIRRMDQREKRAIEFIGNLISKAFGNPGPEDWKKNNANIMALKRAIESQRMNSVLLHKNIDQDRHDIEKQNKILKQVSIELFKSENAVDQLQTELLDLQSYFELEAMADAVDEILESLFDIKTDAKTGRCNLRGLSHVFLIENLRTIESNKLGFAPVFASWEWENFYKHEMCTIALDSDDLWVTLRIPIIRPSEKLFRVIPSSSFIWIRQAFDNYGIDTTLFKDKNHEIFTIMARNDFDQCSNLGSTRVCNIRKSSFKEMPRFMVPLQLSLDRFVIICNETTNGTVAISTKCNETTSENYVSTWSALAIPSFCSVRNKNLIIHQKLDYEFVSSTIALETRSPLNFEHRQLELPVKNRIQINVTEYKAKSDPKEFEKNDYQTKNELSKVSKRHDEIFDEFRSVKIGGLTSTVCIVSILGIAFLIMARNKCKSRRMKGNGMNVSFNVETPNRQNDESTISERFIDEKDNDECEQSNKNESSESNDQGPSKNSINKFM